MERYIPVTFLDLHNPLFVQTTTPGQGMNLGQKIDAKKRGAEMTLDTQTGIVWVYFQSKIALVPLANIASAHTQVSAELQSELGFSVQAAQSAPPAVARGRQKQVETSIEATDPEYDPNDTEAAALHRARVRAASATSNRPAVVPQSDFLIQQARAHAAGAKNPAQVSSPVDPTLMGVQGKPKALSHAALKAQLAQEAKSGK